MHLSNTDVLSLAFRPFCAEGLELVAESKGSFAWKGMAKAIKYSRNRTYMAATVTAICVVGSLVLRGAPAIGCAAVATGGVVLAVVNAKKAYEFSKIVQSFFNQGGSV
jgi:hypothetical protein